MTEIKLKIRKFTKFEEIKKFLPLLLEKYPQMEPDELISGIEKLIDKNNYILLVAYEGEKAIAIAGLNFNYLLCSGDYLQISNIYTIPEFRGAGVALQLLSHAEKIAREKNCKQVTLYSYTENEKPLQTYEKAGFKITANYFTKQL
jgi:ribosomal protein S18 acetylase RimI-like enzyme